MMPLNFSFLIRGRESLPVLYLLIFLCTSLSAFPISNCAAESAAVGRLVVEKIVSKHLAATMENLKEYGPFCLHIDLSEGVWVAVMALVRRWRDQRLFNDQPTKAVPEKHNRLVLYKLIGGPTGVDGKRNHTLSTRN